MFFSIYNFDFFWSGHTVSFFYSHRLSTLAYFPISPRTTSFPCVLTLLLVGGKSRLCILLTTAGGDGIHTIHSHIIFCWRLDLENIFSKSRATPENCPDIMDDITFECFWLGLWLRANKLRQVFGYYSLSFDSDFLEPMLFSIINCHWVRFHAFPVTSIRKKNNFRKLWFRIHNTL